MEHIGPEIREHIARHNKLERETYDKIMKILEIASNPHRKNQYFLNIRARTLNRAPLQRGSNLQDLLASALKWRFYSVEMGYRGDFSCTSHWKNQQRDLETRIDDFWQEYHVMKNSLMMQCIFGDLARTTTEKMDVSISFNVDPKELFVAMYDATVATQTVRSYIEALGHKVTSIDHEWTRAHDTFEPRYFLKIRMS